MTRIALITLLFSSMASPALAAEEEKETEWTIGFSGGATLIEQSNDQKFASASITKDIGPSYIGATLSYVDSGPVPGLFNAIPASTTEVTLSAGTSFDAFNIDGYISYGKRDFDTESLSRNGNRVTIDADGDSFGTGLSASYDIVASDNLFLTPIIAVDYNKLDIARFAVLPNGETTAVSNSEDGITGSLGLAVQQLFGEDDQHLASLLINGVTTSNTTSFNPGTGQYPVIRALAAREEPGQKDSWAEIGGSLSFEIGKGTRLDLSIIRTFGFLNSDATSLSAGVRHSF